MIVFVAKNEEYKMKKYLFLIGAPGSKWSSVGANIYNSVDIDRSDSSINRVYSRDGGQIGVYHHGAYFDPGMEFGKWFNKIDEHTKIENETEINRPFTDIHKNKYRIIKSHTLATHLNYIITTWPIARIILVYRSNRKCFSWWQECGGHDITYPNYKWYETDKIMQEQIALQNNSIKQFAEEHKLSWDIKDNLELCEKLNIAQPKHTYQNYKEWHIGVTIK